MNLHYLNKLNSIEYLTNNKNIITCNMYPYVVTSLFSFNIFPKILPNISFVILYDILFVTNTNKHTENNDIFHFVSLSLII